ncbi:carbon-nitrogen hydrolase [Sesbania bispinosa]|nr:carbon-nitrogen hydrolase [Sesbania bispinosa]
MILLRRNLSEVVILSSWRIKSLKIDIDEAKKSESPNAYDLVDLELVSKCHMLLTRLRERTEEDLSCQGGRFRVETQGQHSADRSVNTENAALLNEVRPQWLQLTDLPVNEFVKPLSPRKLEIVMPISFFRLYGCELGNQVVMEDPNVLDFLVMKQPHMRIMLPDGNVKFWTLKWNKIMFIWGLAGMNLQGLGTFKLVTMCGSGRWRVKMLSP